MTLDDKTFISIDYGRKRIGLAKSDPTGTIASALETIEVKSRREVLNRLQKILEEFQPTALIIGYPLHESGEKSEMCHEIDGFVEVLHTIYDGPIHKVDEFGSSEQATSIIHTHGKKTGRKKGRVDRLAAVVILQRYLNEYIDR